MNYIDGKRVLITGACGTVGSELVRVLLEDSSYNPLELIGIDNNESELFFLDQRYLSDHRAKFFLADVRDSKELSRKFQGIDVVFHAAAFKHVIMCERSPYEAVQTNINGVQNVIQAANTCDVGKVIFTSSDKAVNPTNVMGTSKLMGERLITAANSNARGDGPTFASTRFGNVMGSSGSVIPIFNRQIAQGGPVTLTDSRMTRFVMSIEGSIRLVIDSATIARGGEVFVTKMPVICIKDLAEVMIHELAVKYDHKPELIKIEEIGTKPGEKLYEELMSDEETRRAIELPRYFAIYPAFRGIYRKIKYNYTETISKTVEQAYHSAHQQMLTQTELKKFLLENRLLDDLVEKQHPAQRYWPGDK